MREPDIAQTDRRTLQEPLRLWPGVVAVMLQWLGRFALPIVEPDAIPVGMIGGLVCWLVVVIWWAFFSRAPRLERRGAPVLMVVGLVTTWLFVTSLLRRR